MRKKGQAKRGALTGAQAEEKAAAFIEEFGECLFIVDMVESTNYGKGLDIEAFHNFRAFLDEVNRTFSQYLPENILAAGAGRVEQGFQSGIGDAAWAGINDAAVIPKIIALKEKNYPDLRLYYGVAEDGWGEGMILAK